MPTMGLSSKPLARSRAATEMLRTSVEAARRDLQLALGKLDQMERTENDAGQLADLWAEFLTYANRVFNKLSHGPKHGPSKGWFDRVKHVGEPVVVLLLDNMATPCSVVREQGWFPKTRSMS